MQECTGSASGLLQTAAKSQGETRRRCANAPKTAKFLKFSVGMTLNIPDSDIALTSLPLTIPSPSSSILANACSGVHSDLRVGIGISNGSKSSC